jgi:hypothetical protein
MPRVEFETTVPAFQHVKAAYVLDRTATVLGSLSHCSSLNVRDQASHKYKTSCKMIVLYILIFTFLYRDIKKKNVFLM